ncbi:hypothetical protein ASE73_02665 [Sphingomonas sp. Leaf24]|uniref:hypothetical protein n=1 Tax=unclassified Sphingomonas TaxID=196159 RepID=UPI00070015B7|nr:MULTISPECIES: hypothetical protein [unclassified Sphingomonas]KQM23146.1 hypothetical protein ASE50_02665 [Sphingomonas sp. Leaf5]KQM96004.1 hypothetical protein ASE73_02665 [Sphingomonas sp. Leaf24]
MSDYWMISGERTGSRVKSYSTSGRAGKTTIRVEIEVSDAWSLHDVLRHLHDAQSSPATPNSKD